MKWIITICIALLGVVQVCRSQCPDYDLRPPHLDDVLIKLHLKIDANTQLFSYQYTMKNGVTSTGCINKFELDIAYPDNSIELPKNGLVDYPRHIARFALSFPGAKRIIPVSIPRLPRLKGYTAAWWAGFSNSGKVSWIRASKMFKIEPGATLDSMVILSYGLPSIRSFVVSPSYNPKPLIEVTPENEDSVYNFVAESTADEAKELRRIEDSIKWRGLTVGPTAPPILLSAIEWCDTLTLFIHTSTSLSWLKSTHDNDCDTGERPENGVANNLEKYIQKIYSRLYDGDTNKAVRELNKFVNKVERIYKRSEEAATKGRTDDIAITSEAYALLKYNAEYLIDHLPQKKSR